MSRVIDAFTQYFDGNGQPLSNGTLTFYENGGTTTLQDTYADITQTIPNANPFVLDGEGRVATDIYGSLAYTVVLKDSDNNVIEQFDNVEPRGGISTGESIPDWDSTTGYKANNSIVFAGDGEYYIAIQDNMNQNPVTDTTFQYWKRVEFKEEWSQFITYSDKDIVIGSDDIQYESLTGSNLNNNPVSDGGVNWEKYNTVNWSSGRAYLAGESRLADNGRWYTAEINNTGNNPSSDGGTNWLPSVGKVDKPSNVSPADAATDVLRTPALTSSAFSVSGGSDTHEYSEYQISTDNTFATIDYTSNALTFDLESHLIDFTLLPATQYYWRVKYKGEFAGLSEFSDITSFTTVPNLSEIFSINSDTGTGAARFTLTNVDLSTQSGSIWIFNRDIVSFTKKVDTSRGTDEFDFANNTPEAINAQGVTDYGATGFTVGTDADYNGTGNTISSFSFQNKAGFHDTIRYTGNGTSRSIGHNLNSEVGMMIIKNENETADANSFFYMYHKDLGTSGYNMAGTANIASVFGAATNTTFSLTTSATVNESGDNFIAELFAHNPSQGIFCGTYSGTGSSGLKITTGFPVGLFITVAISGNIAIRGTHIADIVTGTSSYILAQETGNTEQVGSVFSFDVDGVTLDGNGLNASGAIYYFCAIADPTQF